MKDWWSFEVCGAFLELKVATKCCSTVRNNWRRWGHQQKNIKWLHAVRYILCNRSLWKPRDPRLIWEDVIYTHSPQSSSCTHFRLFLWLFCYILNKPTQVYFSWECCIEVFTVLWKTSPDFPSSCGREQRLNLHLWVNFQNQTWPLKQFRNNSSKTNMPRFPVHPSYIHYT